MHRNQKVISIILAAVFVVFTFSAALAAPAAQALPPCIADPDTGKVAGTVTTVDQTGMVTVDTGGGVRCTVNINVTTTATHPIALLLGIYFPDVDAVTLNQALTYALPDLQGCAVLNDTTWTWATCDPDSTVIVPIQVTSLNPKGTYAAVLADGTPITLVVVNDQPTVDMLNSALETLLVYWTVDTLGNRVPVSDQVANWHDQGMGFGVLVKLLAISKASGGKVTVDDLIVEMQGMGMGELFKKYGGKPDMTGVGHVRQEVNGNDHPNSNGQGNGIGNGQGNGNQPPDQDKKDNKAPKDKDNKVKKVCKSVTKGNGKGGGNCP